MMQILLQRVIIRRLSEKESAKDADGNEVVIFKDLDGNTILERRNRGDTYYVYDKLGQLRYILSPQYQEKEDLAAYAYQYDYDECGNLVRKTLPGSQYTQYWYDKEGLLAYEQDALLRDKGLYRFYLYDRFDRVVLVGTTTSCNTNIKNAKLNVSFSSQNGGIANSGYAFMEILLTFPKAPMYPWKRLIIMIRMAFYLVLLRMTLRQ